MSWVDLAALIAGVIGFAFASAGLIARERKARRSARERPAAGAKEGRRRAKRENERIKLTATFLNGTGIAVLLTTAVAPIFGAVDVRPEPLAWSRALAGVAVAFGFHLLGLWVLSLWRSEE